VVAAITLPLALVLFVALQKPTGPTASNSTSNTTLRDLYLNVNLAVGQTAGAKGHLLPPRPSDTVPPMNDSERDSYDPGDIVSVAGVYKPVGRLIQRDPSRELGTQPVTRGHQIVHESFFDTGSELPPLTGYEPGAVWVLRP